MASSSALRLGAGMATFVIMARALGPADFGAVMLWLSVATLMALLGNYGFTPYLLRELGAQPKKAAALLGESLTAKLMLALLLLGAAAVSVPWLDFQQRQLLLMLLLAQLADGLAEVFNVGLRTSGHFEQEARLTAVVAIAQLTCVGGALLIVPTPLGAATGYLLSRLAALVSSGLLMGRYVSGVVLVSIQAGWQALRAARAYAVDTILQSLMGQIDSVVLNHFAGPGAVGLYQAGLRLFNGGAQAAPILANVLLPQASAAFANRDTSESTAQRFAAESRKLQWSFLAVGAIFGLTLAWAARPLTFGIFGHRFEGLEQVLPWLGALFHLRMFAASWGVVLTAAGAQRYRARSNIVMWLLVAALVPLLLPPWGLTGWVLALLAGHAWLALAYLWHGLRLHRDRIWAQPIAALALGLLFVPMLSMQSVK